jgi:hypothetical protein
MLYLVALMSLVGNAGDKLPSAARSGNVVVAGAALLDVARAVATVDLAGEVGRALTRARPASPSILRR